MSYTVVTTAPWVFAMIPQQVEVPGFHNLDAVCHKNADVLSDLHVRPHVYIYKLKIKVLLAAQISQTPIEKWICLSILQAKPKCFYIHHFQISPSPLRGHVVEGF